MEALKPFLNKVFNMNCLHLMREMPENSVDLIVTDPPYGLSFLDKSWDYDVPSKEIWAEAYRILKPGGNLLSFWSARTYHRGTTAIEDGGFEIRDQLLWIYTSGFPKGMDISKGIDNRKFIDWVKTQPEKKSILFDKKRDYILNKNVFFKDNNCEVKKKLYIDAKREYLRYKEELQKEAGTYRETIGYKKGGMGTGDSFGMYQTEKVKEIEEFDESIIPITAPATPEAKQWDGWETSLKPAHEPITLARKHLYKTVIDSVLTYKCGGINVKDCAIKGCTPNGDVILKHPPNIFYSCGCEKDYHENKECCFHDLRVNGNLDNFFYCSKIQPAERSFIYNNQKYMNTHSTIKPKGIIRELIKLFATEGMVVYDPFCGSGTTPSVCIDLGLDWIASEMDENYYNNIIIPRIKYEYEQKKQRLF